MGDSVQDVINQRNVVFACIGVFCFLLLVGLSLWGYRHYKHRGFYLKDHRRLIAEAKLLTAETAKIKREVDHDVYADKSTKLKNREILTSAEEWDTGIRNALSAWEDLMSADKKVPDIESEKGGKVDLGRNKGYDRYVIGKLREKSMEGIERRKGLSPQMQKIHDEVLARRVDHLMDRLNPKQSAGKRAKLDGKMTAKTRPSLAPRDAVQSASFESLYYAENKRQRPKPARRTVSCAPDLGKAGDDKLTGLCIYV